MKTPAVLVFTLIIILGCYDFAVVYFFPSVPSISQFFQGLQVKAPFVTIVMAICVGHLLFPTVKYEKEEK